MPKFLCSCDLTILDVTICQPCGLVSVSRAAALLTIMEKKTCLNILVLNPDQARLILVLSPFGFLVTDLWCAILKMLKFIFLLFYIFN
jgi:hypothetical protein